MYNKETEELGKQQNDKDLILSLIAILVIAYLSY